MKKHEIEAKALKVLQDHGMLGMAVDPVALANAMNVKVYNAKFGEEGLAGMIARRTGAATIYINADDRPRRKRFTIAHELGHFVLHLAGGEGQFIDNDDSFRTPQEPDAAWTAERRREWEANVFAAALLMPEPIVRQVWNQVRDIEGMAEWFQVSPQAMAIRLHELRIST